MELIIFIFIIFLILKKSNALNGKTTALFYKALKAQNFVNVSTVWVASSYMYVRADLNGENFLFEVKTGSNPVGINEINELYDKSRKLHIHNCILVDFNNQLSQNVLKKMSEYNIKFWDNKKVISLLQNTSKNSKYNMLNPDILPTSDTSDDHCKIENSEDPIQDGETVKHSILGGLFKKPERL